MFTAREAALPLRASASHSTPPSFEDHETRERRHREHVRKIEQNGTRYLGEGKRPPKLSDTIFRVSACLNRG